MRDLDVETNVSFAWHADLDAHVSRDPLSRLLRPTLVIVVKLS